MWLDIWPPWQCYCKIILFIFFSIIFPLMKNSTAEGCMASPWCLYCLGIYRVGEELPLFYACDWLAEFMLEATDLAMQKGHLVSSQSLLKWLQSSFPAAKELWAHKTCLFIKCVWESLHLGKAEIDRNDAFNELPPWGAWFTYSSASFVFHFALSLCLAAVNAMCQNSWLLFMLQMLLSYLL